MINIVEKVYNPISNKSKIYKVTYNSDEVIFVPLDENNRHYQEIQEWIADGGIVIDNPPE